MEINNLFDKSDILINKLYTTYNLYQIEINKENPAFEPLKTVQARILNISLRKIFKDLMIFPLCIITFPGTNYSNNKAMATCDVYNCCGRKCKLKANSVIAKN